MWLRHLLAIVVLPFTVTVVVPWWLAVRSSTTLTLGATPIAILIQLAGLISLALGLSLFVASVHHFVVHGRGTLAPWDPPPKLVVIGPYRYVRNPMISGVLFVLFAEALILLSRPHAAWTLIFLVINLVYIPLVEEPMLEGRFGEPYREYKRRVPRMLPIYRRR